VALTFFISCIAEKYYLKMNYDVSWSIFNARYPFCCLQLWSE